MNKKSMAKIGAASLIIIVFFLLIFFIVIPKITGTGILEKNKYFLGEKVRIDLSSYENYKIKIITPSNTYIRNEAFRLLT